MGQDQAHRGLPCGYCGQVTDENEHEHVIPYSLHTKSGDPNFERATIPACRKCNGEFANVEAHVKAVLAAAGETATPERLEHMDTVIRCFTRPKGGEGDFWGFWNQLEQVEIEGKRRHRIYPGKSERVLMVVRKVMRGFTHRRDSAQIIPDDRAHALLLTTPVTSDVEAELEPLYHVRNVANVRACFFQGEHAKDLHSVWAIKLLDVEFGGVIEPPPTPHEA